MVRLLPYKPQFERFLHISPADRMWGLFVSNVGDATVAPGTRYLAERDPVGYDFTWKQGRILEEYQLVYISEGAGLFESAVGSGRRPRTQQRKITGGTVFILFPGVWHRFMPYLKTGWHEHWISFNGPIADELRRNNLIDPRRPIVHTGVEDDLLKWFGEVINLVHDEPAGFQPQAAAITFRILARLYATTIRRLPRDRQAHDVIWQARRALSEDLDTTLDTHELAERLNLGYSWFRQLFRKQTGLSPHQYRLQARLQRASTLLRTTTLPVKQIATMVGFDCPFQFSRLFKKKRSYSPQAWRLRSQGKAGKRRRPQ